MFGHALFGKLPGLPFDHRQHNRAGPGGLIGNDAAVMVGDVDGDTGGRLGNCAFLPPQKPRRGSHLQQDAQFHQARIPLVSCLAGRSCRKSPTTHASTGKTMQPANQGGAPQARNRRHPAQKRLERRGHGIGASQLRQALQEGARVQRQRHRHIARRPCAEPPGLPVKAAAATALQEGG